MAILAGPYATYWILCTLYTPCTLVSRQSWNGAKLRRHYKILKRAESKAFQNPWVTLTTDLRISWTGFSWSLVQIVSPRLVSFNKNVKLGRYLSSPLFWFCFFGPNLHYQILEVEDKASHIHKFGHLYLMKKMSIGIQEDFPKWRTPPDSIGITERISAPFTAYGMSTGISEDIEGDHRPYGDGFDIGADEVLPTTGWDTPASVIGPGEKGK